MRSKPSKESTRFLGKTKASYPLKPKTQMLASFQQIEPIKLARIEAAQRFLSIDPVDDSLLAFSTRCLVQANLPHSDPKKSPHLWVRQNGDFTLSIQSDIVIDKKTKKETLVGIPYGVIPRLILMYICSEAKRTKSRRISLGDNLSGFLRELGMDSSGGKKGGIARFKEQLRRLVTAKIKFEHDDGKSKVGFNASIAKQYFFFWDEKNPDQDTLFKNEIILDDDFFAEIMRSPVPLHLGVVGQLKNSALGLDLYTWLTYRVTRLNKAVFIKWEELEQQLGSSYSNTYDFSKRARQVFKEIKLLWKDLNFEFRTGGFLLEPSVPSIAPKSSEKEQLRGNCPN